MKRFSFAIRVMILSFFIGIGGCGGGGGGGGGGGDSVTQTGTVSGVVSGTTVLVVDETGSIISSDDTSGKQKDVDTDNDSIPDAYSIQLTGIPLNKSIRIFLVHNGAIYPMYYDSEPDGTFDTNVFALTDGTDINLGFINTALTGSKGLAIPEHNPTENSSVVAGLPNAVIPAGINEPDTSGLTLEELNTKGLNALADGWVLGARVYFEQAVAVSGSTTSDNANTARFMFAMTRVVALGFDTLSDGNSGDMNRLGDILDRLGMANDYSRANWNLIAAPDSLPSDSPAGSEYQSFLYNVVGPELIGAIGNLDAISTGFNLIWTDLISNSQTESDYGDVLFLRGAFKSVLATISTQMAYDLGADVDEIYNRNHDVDLTNDITVENFLANNASFLKLADVTMLTEAKTYLTASALDDFTAAIDEILAETDSQLNDLVTIDMIAGDTKQPELAKEKIAQVKNSILNGASTVGKAMLDLKQFFDGGVDFRSPSPLLPDFSGNSVAGLFPDPMFNGVVLQPDLNEDISPQDGIPDRVQ